MKILFVENQCVFAATVIRQFLSQHLITVATNLFAARRALADASFDSVLVDYDLDDGSGDELVKESKASWSKSSASQPATKETLRCCGLGRIPFGVKWSSTEFTGTAAGEK